MSFKNYLELMNHPLVRRRTEAMDIVSDIIGSEENMYNELGYTIGVLGNNIGDHEHTSVPVRLKIHDLKMGNEESIDMSIFRAGNPYPSCVPEDLICNSVIELVLSHVSLRYGGRIFECHTHPNAFGLPSIADANGIIENTYGAFISMIHFVIEHEELSVGETSRLSEPADKAQSRRARHKQLERHSRGR